MKTTVFELNELFTPRKITRYTVCEMIKWVKIAIYNIRNNTWEAVSHVSHKV